MSMTLAQLASVIDKIAPFRLAYEWDNVGLLVGDPGQSVERVLIALEANDAVIARARETGCQALLVHHPLIFKPARAIRADSASGRLVMELIRAGLGLIAAHTNLDRVLRGTNGALASLLGLRDLQILEPAASDQLFKFTVFVPRDYTPKIIEAIHRGGGGWIGRYSHCTFRAPGIGTFLPEEGANPFLGHRGALEEAEEDRLETVVPRSALRSVLQEVRQAHPYEEVAFDVFPLHDADPKYGLGAVGTLPSKTTLRALAGAAGRACGAEFATFVGNPSQPVKRVAIITGSAGSAWRSVSPGLADVLVTGELSYHNALEAAERGLGVVLLGHAASERIFAVPLRQTLLEEPAVAEAGLRFEVYDRFPEPFQLVNLTRKTSPPQA